MKPRDIILSQINHRETDVIPYTLPIDNGLGEKLDAHYGNALWRDQLKPFMQNVNVVDATKGMWDDYESNLNRDLYGTLWRTDLRHP